jgi:tRNA G18 (ribose-2'-O)-methylase SpoU
VAAGLALTRLYCVPAREAWAQGILGAGSKPTVLSEAEISKTAGYPFHRGALALAKRPATRSLDQALPQAAGRSTILVLPETGDPENLGALFRSAAALGCDALLLGPAGPDPLCRRVLRVSMGASLRLPWARLGGPKGLEALAARGFEAIACVLDPSAVDLRVWRGSKRRALLLGNEARGLGEEWLDACQSRVTLPMLGGADSLNVAAAAAIFLYTLSYDS